MCSKDNLRVFLLALNTIVLVSAVALVLLGFVLLLNGDFVDVYGGIVVFWGLALLLSGCLVGAAGCMSFYGAQSHNKCLLLTVVAMTGFIMIWQGSVGSNIGNHSEPAFSDELVTSCVASGPSSQYNTPECKAYFEHQDTSRLFKLWLAKFQASAEDEQLKAEMQKLEKDNACCGFGPAEVCIGPTTTFDADNVDGVAFEEVETPMPEAMATCSAAAEGWYAASRFCKLSANGHVGCPYLFSISTGCIRATTIRGGCALHFQQQIRSSLTPIGDAAVVLIFLQAFMLCGSFCLFLKRKEHDVLPPPEAFVDKRFEQYGVVLEPKVDPMKPGAGATIEIQAAESKAA